MNPSIVILPPSFHTLPAFETLVGWIYETWPSVSETRDDCKSLLQTCVLAAQYDAVSLLDAIIKYICEHHRKVTADLHHLVWITDHARDNIGLAMTAYQGSADSRMQCLLGLIWSTRSIMEVLPAYISRGDGLVRYELVKAIAHRA